MVTMILPIFHFDSTKAHRFSPGTPISSCGNTDPRRCGANWISWKGSLEVTALSNINKVSLLYLTCLLVLDEDEILTYEEVGLLQPSRNQKRPIVLIGKINSCVVVLQKHENKHVT